MLVKIIFLTFFIYGCAIGNVGYYCEGSVFVEESAYANGSIAGSKIIYESLNRFLKAESESGAIEIFRRNVGTKKIKSVTCRVGRIERPYDN